MTEVTFAKSFLTALDSRPSKLSPDHVEDPRSYPARPPYILPRMPRPMSQRPGQARPAPGQERSVAVHVRSLRNPPLDVRLPAQPLGASLLDVKAAVATEARIPAARLKLLHRKKPVPDSKVLGDLAEAEAEAGAGGGGRPADVIELSVMVLGGAAAVTAAPAPEPAQQPEKAAATPAAGAATAQGLSGEAVLRTDQFWSDLRGFLSQRIRDEKITEELFARFLSSWESGR